MEKTAYIVSTDTLAKVIGKTRQRVNQLAAEGVLHRKAPGKWDLFENTRDYIAFLESNGRSSNGNLEVEKLQAEVDYKRNKADLAELALRELEGKMHRSEDVETVVTALVYAIRGMLLALPGRLAMDVLQAKSAAEASEIIRAEVYKVLEELSNHEYDSTTYKKLVGEREGWEDAGGEDPE